MGVTFYWSVIYIKVISRKIWNTTALQKVSCIGDSLVSALAYKYWNFLASVLIFYSFGSIVASRLSILM